jgi:predicted nucleic acid-binding protein
MNYYFDTCIWIDYFENRKNFFGINLGNPVEKLLLKIMKKKDKILISDAVYDELCFHFEKEYLDEMLNLLSHINVLKNISATDEQRNEAVIISKQRKLYFFDVLHAILATQNKSILVTRDKHFLFLKDVCKSKKPEELI